MRTVSPGPPEAEGVRGRRPVEHQGHLPVGVLHHPELPVAELPERGDPPPGPAGPGTARRLGGPRDRLTASALPPTVRPMPASAVGPTESWTFPNRSTQATDVTTTGPGGPATVARRPRRPAGGQLHQGGRVDRGTDLPGGAADGEMGGGRGEHVAPVEGARAAAGGPAGPGPGPPPSAPHPTSVASGTRSPLSGPTIQPGRPDATSRATARRSVPTPGSTTASTTPAPRCGPL